MSNGESGSQAQTLSNTEIVKPESGTVRADAETLKIKLEADEIRSRLARKWYDIRPVAPKLISGLVGIALAATYFVGLIQPIREREQEARRLELHVLSLKNEIQKHENMLRQRENERLSQALEAVDERVSEALQAENQELRAALAEAESRKMKRLSLLEKLSGEYNMLAQKQVLSEKQRSDLAEVASTAGEEVEALQQEIGRLRVAQEAAHARSKRITERGFADWRNVWVTVLDPSGSPLSGIYLDRFVAGASTSEPLEHSTDAKGQRYVQVRTGDKICTQETHEFRSACRTIGPDTREIRLIVERR
jgi:hypothetical protein